MILIFFLALLILRGTDCNEHLNKNIFWLKQKDERWGNVCIPPKNGSSMWKRLFLKKRFPHLSMMHPHLENSTIALSLFQGEKSKDGVIIFRNPIDRFLSAYEDKINNQINCPSMAPEKLNCDNVSVDVMIDLMMEDKTYYNPHFAPQSDLCDVEINNYTVYDIAHIHEWYPEFISRFDLLSESSTGWKGDNDLYRSNYDCFFKCDGLKCSEMDDREKVSSMCSSLQDRRFVHTSHETHTGHISKLSQSNIDKLIRYYRDDYFLTKQEKFL